MTLRLKITEILRRKFGYEPSNEEVVCGIVCWHARGRADRATKAERAVVALAVKWGSAETTHDAQVAVNALTMALRNLERAKGRK